MLAQNWGRFWPVYLALGRALHVRHNAVGNDGDDDDDQGNNGGAHASGLVGLRGGAVGGSRSAAASL